MGIDTSVVKCNECGSRELEYVEKRGERFCKDCGLVLETNIVDEGAEWRNFSDQDGGDRSRVGMPATNLLHDKGLSTSIDWRNQDHSGAPINSNIRSQMYRMRKWQQRSRTVDAKSRNLAKALRDIESICSKMDLPKIVRQRAADIYKKALDSDLVRGRSIEAMVAASIFIANQQLRTARTVDDIAEVCRMGPKEIGRTYRDIKRKLMIKTPVPDPKIYVERFGSELGLSSVAKTKTIEIIIRAEEMELTHGKSPSGVAAAALYIASHLTGQVRTQREISEVSNVTEVTIRNRYKQLAAGLNIELDI